MFFRKHTLLLGTVSAIALAGAAQAQDSAPETVVVTGSRIVSNGYQAPTPVTTVTAQDLTRATPESIPAGLQQLPQFSMTSGSNVASSQAGTPSAGNYLNLRGLGSIENLILLDGQRLPATSFNGTVDTNIIPQAFIQRVDVVTGGASAAYGSDAVSGVVNFILDKKFNGIKGQIQGGVSDYDDDAQLKLSVAGGTSLFDGRGHFEISYDHFQQPGIKCDRKTPDDCSRPFAYGNMLTGSGTKANPYTLSKNVSINNATFGTYINGAYNANGQKVNNFTYTGSQFGTGGVVEPFNPGNPTGTSNISTDGDGAYSFGTTLTSALQTDQGYARFDYDITPDIHSHVSLIYSQSQTSYVTVASGTQFSAFNVFQDNAFLPTSVSQAMAAQGVAYFTASRVEADQTPKLVKTLNGVWIGSAGLDGSLGNWKWTVDYSHGDSQLRTDHYGNFIQSRWYAALDAVRDPSTGNVVCRTTLTNPGLYPGCTPWNPFGVGSPSQASYNYVEGVSKYQVENRQDDVSGQISGPLFDLPAGTVNLATGFEYRYEQLKETSNNNPADPIDQTGFCHAVDATGAPTGAPVTSAQCNAAAGNGIVSSTPTPFLLTYNSTNVGKAAGNQSIEEGFLEFAVPVVKDLPYAEDIDLDLAYRFAQYSVSGSATTWKLGGNWQPFDELRIRTTLSRDFRAPTLYELFAGTSATRGLFDDAVHSGVQANTITLTQGNPDLKPEIGNTMTLGAVWTPDYVPGFSASLDYYAIKIDNEITQLPTLVLDSDCEASNGTSPLCTYINRPTPFSDHSEASFPTSITRLPFNQAYVTMNGWDLDMTENLPLDILFPTDANMVFRFIGNYTPNYTTNAGSGAASIQNAGLNGEGAQSSLVMPKTRFNLSANYINGPLNLGVRIRYIGPTRYTNNPTLYYTNNEISQVAYVDLNASYDFTVDNHAFSAYAGIQNVGNKFVFVPNTGQPEEFYPTQQELYDVVGRYYTFGIRFNY